MRCQGLDLTDTQPGTIKDIEAELAYLHWVLCGHMLCSSHLVSLTRTFHWKTISTVVLLAHSPWGDFAEHFGARYISGTRSHKCRQPSFMTPHLGIASSQLTVSLTSRWKICLYSPFQGDFYNPDKTPGSSTCICI